MISREFVSVAVAVVLPLAILSPLQVFAQDSLLTEPSSPFSVALESLQKQINYTFESIGLLRRAMTHASFSEENNKALSILGANVIDASVALRSLVMDVDISSRDLSRRISEISSVDSSCAGDGSRLGLQKVVRVSPKTDSSTPAVVCGAFRAMFGAIAVDSRSSDDAGRIFWSVHGGHVGRAISR
ncbi:Protein NUCLEAR FUSION DEFECTIVE 2 like [Actinidia chinensis var. chinensis]|uniref:Protein NUCLEAR FUSION DEFECTIVE 2 like n=1 Tax=Actinidia chinensis var. chinensis TaxID=1590841 RepID=A0A2R6PS85_ACTCC|nr:Protein NUCLEAR FUSION DEFECTIVE 2 like [Actinidia chinensis var. chinensis]